MEICSLDSGPTRTDRLFYGCEERNGVAAWEVAALRKRRWPGTPHVYQYGCLPPVQGQEAMLEQIRKATAFWNALVAHWREQRERYRAIVSSDTDVAAIEERRAALTSEIEQLRKAIRAQRQRTRSAQGAPSEVREAIARLVAERRALVQQARAARQAARERLRQELDALRAWDAAELVRLRREAAAGGLYWGNYNAVWDAYKVAVARAAKTGGELRPRRFTGEGRLVVQVQNESTAPPLYAKGLFGSNRLLEIDPVPEAAWTSPSRAERRRLARTLVRIRVGSTPGRRPADRRPVWVVLPMVMHRPIPAGAIVQRATLTRRRVGYRWEYRLSITVLEPETTRASRPGVVGVDIGWRKLPDGSLRVAVWAGDDGASGEVRLHAHPIGKDPASSLLTRWEQAQGLRSLQDKHLETARASLAAYFATVTLPAEWESWAEGIRTLAQWRSPVRFAGLLRFWQKHRLPADDEALARLEAWWKRHRHLYQWECDLRDRAIGWRTDIYRVEAARLARRYGTIRIEAFDLREVAEKPEAEFGPRTVTRADRQRVIAAVSEFRQALLNAAAKWGAQVEIVPSEWTTQRCHACGVGPPEVPRWDASQEILHTCAACGATWDQDHNAAMNLRDYRAPANPRVGG